MRLFRTTSVARAWRSCCFARARFPTGTSCALSGPSRKALPRAPRSGSLNVVIDAEWSADPNFPEDAYQQVFVAEFIHVRKSLGTCSAVAMGKQTRRMERHRRARSEARERREERRCRVRQLRSLALPPWARAPESWLRRARYTSR